LNEYRKVLEKISQANGFENDVKKVSRKMLFYDTEDSFPVLMVLGGDERYEDVMGGYVLSRFQIKIRGYSKDVERPDEILNSLIADTLRILDNGDYNKYHVSYKPVSLSTDEGWMSVETEGVGMFELTIEQLYKFQQGAP
jgi:hypothetical protein